MLLFDAAVVISSIAVLVQLTLEGSAAGDPTVWRSTALAVARVVELICLGVFVMEVVVRAGLMGPLRYWRSSAFARLDIALVLVAVAGTIAEVAGGLSDPLSAALSFVRILRVVRLLRTMPKFGTTLVSEARGSRPSSGSHASRRR